MQRFPSTILRNTSWQDICLLVLGTFKVSKRKLLQESVGFCCFYHVRWRISTFCIIGIISLIYVGFAKALRKKMVELYPSEAESFGMMQDDRIPGKRMEIYAPFALSK